MPLSVSLTRAVAGYRALRTAFAGEARTLENPAIPLSSDAIVGYLGGPRSWSGFNVTERGAMQNMAVWRAVNLLASTAAGLPLKLYKDASPGGVRTEVSDNDLFRGEAYPDLTWYEYVETTLLHLLLNGNAYSLKIRNEAGDRILRVLPLPPDCIEVERGKASERNPSGKTFRLALPGQVEHEVLTPREVMQIPGLSYDGLKGMSPIEYARNAIGTAGAAEMVAAKMFDSGLMNAGFIQSEMELNEAEAKKIKQRWRENVAGIVRSYEIAILANGLKYVPATIPPKDAQWLEAREFGIEEIARLYGVPADLLMDNSATGNTNVEQRAASFVKFGFGSLLRRVEKRFSVHLAPRATFAEFSLDALLRGDALSRSQVYASAITAGWMTVNEVRALENLPPLATDEEAQDDEEQEPPAPLAPVPDPEANDEEDQEDEANAA